MSEEATVVSEVHTFTIDKVGISDESNSYFSHFTFALPPSWKDVDSKGKNSVTSDEDGDLELPGRRSTEPEDEIVIEHNRSTTIKLVGEQVWRGALLLADYVLHRGEYFKGKNVLELGAGTGLTSIITSHYANKVICTDVDAGDILPLCRRNFERNSKFCQGIFKVMEFDWYWNEIEGDLKNELQDVEIVLAADVVYCTELTDAFFRTVKLVMSVPPEKELYIAIERRYCFTIADLDAVAPMYEDFLRIMERLLSSIDMNLTWTAVQIPVEGFPQYFNYEKVKELVLWKVTAKNK